MIALEDEDWGFLDWNWEWAQERKKEENLSDNETEQRFRITAKHKNSEITDVDIAEYLEAIKRNRPLSMPSLDYLRDWPE